MTAPAALHLDTAGMTVAESTAAPITIKMIGMRIYGDLAEEWHRRGRISEERYEREWRATHRRLMSRLDHALAQLGEATP